MSNITITKEQLAAVIKIKTDAQDEFYSITDEKIAATLTPDDRAKAMYQKGREEAISYALYLMDIREKQ